MKTSILVAMFEEREIFWNCWERKFVEQFELVSYYYGISFRPKKSFLSTFVFLCRFIR